MKNLKFKYTWMLVAIAVTGSAVASSWDLALETTERAIARAEQTERKLPVEGSISSPYGMREHPLTDVVSQHKGIDIVAAEGTEFFAAEMGRVTFAGVAGTYGKMIEIAHLDGSVSRYAHASKLLVSEGQRIHKGEVIGEVGATGAATGPHLHYEMLVNGVHVDPVSNHQIIAQASAPNSIEEFEADENAGILAQLAEQRQTNIAIAKAAGLKSLQEGRGDQAQPSSEPYLVSRLVPFTQTNLQRPEIATAAFNDLKEIVLLDDGDIETSIRQAIEQVNSSLTLKAS